MQARTLPTSDAPSRHAWLRSIACAKKVVSEESRKSLGLMLGTTAAYGGLTLVEYAAIFEGNYVTGGGPALFTHLRYHGVMDVIEEKRDSIVRDRWGSECGLTGDFIKSVGAPLNIVRY